MPQADLDFPAYIPERARDFTSREWLFAEIDRWLSGINATRILLPIREPASARGGAVQCLVGG